jgi:hypothetical protein
MNGVGSPEPELPDLSFRTNHRWTIIMGLIWTALMLPSDIAQYYNERGLMLFLTVVGMASFFIAFAARISPLTGGRTFKELRPQMGYPWGLMLGTCAYFMVFSLGIFVAMEVFLP